ncbi:MAG TPA: NRDE family protein [Thermoanaerobaculia bacterium]|nr:NRDE family protein [Thermoanaerobaculia bacterium]
MCLIALAHRASERFPFVLAANRDEDHLRPTRAAHFWDDAPDVLGGRDVLAGGSWLAITRGGRFAAVTNLRGAVPGKRSRGALVRAFATSATPPEEFAAEIVRDAAEYSGFHLLVGEMGRSAHYCANIARAYEPGIYGLSNAPDGEHWPKVEVATNELSRALVDARDAEDLAARLLRFLGTPRHRGRVEEEVFIVGERYGTRSSTVVIATMDEILFIEQSYLPSGVAESPMNRFVL